MFKNITFMNGYEDVEGGAFLIIGGNCSFVNCTFVNNTAGRGGAVLGYSSTINFSDCTFINNRAGHDWAIHNAGATIYAERCNFKTKSDSISGVNLAVHSFAFHSDRYRCGEKITFDCDASDIMLEFYRFDRLFCTYHCSGQDAIVLPYFGEDEYENPYPYDVFYNSNGTRIYVGTVDILCPLYYPSNLTVSAATVYNSKDYLTITLKDDDGSPMPGRDLIVDFNGVKTLKTDDNGQIKVSTEGLVPGVYTLRARFEDSNVFGKSECCVDITVKKAATSIISSAITTLYNEDGYLKATLKDENGYVLAGLNVTVVLNGKTKTLTTDSSGAVTLSTKDLVPKSYTASVSFAGNTNYTDSAKSLK